MGPWSDFIEFTWLETRVSNFEHFWWYPDRANGVLALGPKVFGRRDVDRTTRPVERGSFEFIDLATAQSGDNGQRENLELFRLFYREFFSRIFNQRHDIKYRLIAGHGTLFQFDPRKRQGVRQNNTLRAIEHFWTEQAARLTKETVYRYPSRSLLYRIVPGST